MPSNPSSPFGDIACNLTVEELKETAYEVFVAVTRTTGGKALTYISQGERTTPEKTLSSTSFSSPGSGSPSLQRTLTSTAASKVKRALGLKKRSPGKEGSPSSSSSSLKGVKKVLTVGELVRIQLGISEQVDGRIRRGLLRVSAGQLGRRVESMVLPLELLQQFKPTDFPDQEEYSSWQSRNLKILEAGLIHHPLTKPNKSDNSPQQLRRIINGNLETGKNSESMQALRSVVTVLASRSPDGSNPEKAHWADGIPLNLHLYQALLEACFDREDGSIIEEVDEVLEMVKKTWSILGIDQVLHNLSFTWVLFSRSISAGQPDVDLLLAADTQLAAVAKDAKTTKDPSYSKILSSVLSLIMNWAEQRLLAYHDTFHAGNMDSMYSVVSLGVAAARILTEDISTEYRRNRKDVDVARSRVDAYIRSSLRTAFAQRMEQADSNRRSAKTGGKTSSLPLLCILAKDIGLLADKEKDVFTPVLKKWHPLAAGVAMATLHSCYANELKQFISGLSELTSDSVDVLKAADKLEKDLVQIAVEDAVDSEDGGKAVIREMTPFEAESAIASLARNWIKTRTDRLREWIDRSGQKEEWTPGANKDNIAQSVVEILRLLDETLESFFKLPIPMLPTLLPDLLSAFDKSLQLYVSKAKSGCGTRNSFMPQLPGLTRCTVEARLWKKNEKPQEMVQKSLTNVDTSLLGLKKLCVRMNTLNHIMSELDNLGKKAVTQLRNSESAQSDVVNGLDIRFDLARASCQEGIQFLCETTAYKAVFQDLGYVIWDKLYVGEPSVTRVEAVVGELDRVLETISGVVHPRLRNRALTALMKATFDAFLLVILASGPGRAFSVQDGQVIEEDLRTIEGLFLADGDGLPAELVEKAATQARAVVPLYKVDTEKLIDRFKRIMADSGHTAKAKLPLPPTSGVWSPTEPNTVLRVLCHRNDETASRFLKKTYHLPKKL